MAGGRTYAPPTDRGGGDGADGGGGAAGGGGRGGGEVRVHRLMIEGGEFELDHARVPLELDLPDFNGRLLMGRGGMLTGRIAFGPGSIRVGTALPFRVGTELFVQFDGPNLNITSGRIYTAHLDQ